MIPDSMPGRDRISGFDCLKDCFVICNNLLHAARFGQMKLPDAVDMPALSAGHIMQADDSRRVEDASVELAVCVIETREVTPCCYALLFIDECAQVVHDGAVCGSADRFNRLLLQRPAQELRLSCLADINQTDACGALGDNIDESFFTQPYQRIAHG